MINKTSEYNGLRAEVRLIKFDSPSLREHLLCCPFNEKWKVNVVQSRLILLKLTGHQRERIENDQQYKVNTSDKLARAQRYVRNYMFKNSTQSSSAGAVFKLVRWDCCT